MGFKDNIAPGDSPVVANLKQAGAIIIGLTNTPEFSMRARRSRVLRNWLTFLETYPLILTPLSVKRTPGARADLGGDAAVRSLFWNDLRFMGSINVLGLPAAVVPTGLVAGTPVGVQLIASRYREDVCLDAAAAIEARVGIMAKRLWEQL